MGFRWFVQVTQVFVGNEAREKMLQSMSQNFRNVFVNLEHKFFNNEPTPNNDCTEKSKEKGKNEANNKSKEANKGNGKRNGEVQSDSAKR